MDLLATCGNINIQSALLRSEDLILLHHLLTGPIPLRPGRGGQWFYCKEDLNIEGIFAININTTIA